MVDRGIFKATERGRENAIVRCRALINSPFFEKYDMNFDEVFTSAYIRSDWERNENKKERGHLFTVLEQALSGNILYN